MGGRTNSLMTLGHMVWFPTRNVHLYIFALEKEISKTQICSLLLQSPFHSCSYVFEPSGQKLCSILPSFATQSISHFHHWWGQINTRLLNFPLTEAGHQPPAARLDRYYTLHSWLWIMMAAAPKRPGTVFHKKHRWDHVSERGEGEEKLIHIASLALHPP